jgi:serine/threonine protein kinase
MEKGESLNIWASRCRGGLDMVTGLQVLTHVAERLADLHAAGYVHRDIKPGNIMWLPRRNRWTLIDFGCAARTGQHAPMGFSLVYAAPEVITAHHAGHSEMIVSSAVDSWSVGILAVEMFTGQPAYRVLQHEKTVRNCAWMVMLPAWKLSLLAAEAFSPPRTTFLVMSGCCARASRLISLSRDSLVWSWTDSNMQDASEVCAVAALQGQRRTRVKHPQGQMLLTSS